MECMELQSDMSLYQTCISPILAERNTLHFMTIPDSCQHFLAVRTFVNNCFWGRNTKRENFIQNLWWTPLDSLRTAATTIKQLVHHFHKNMVKYPTSFMVLFLSFNVYIKFCYLYTWTTLYILYAAQDHIQNLRVKTPLHSKPKVWAPMLRSSSFILPSLPSNHVPRHHIYTSFITSRDEGSTTLLESQFQCFTTLSVKKISLVSNLKLSWRNMRPFLLALFNQAYKRKKK